MSSRIPTAAYIIHWMSCNSTTVFSCNAYIKYIFLDMQEFGWYHFLVVIRENAKASAFTYAKHLRTRSNIDMRVHVHSCQITATHEQIDIYDKRHYHEQALAYASKSTYSLMIVMFIHKFMDSASYTEVNSRLPQQSKHTYTFTDTDIYTHTDGLYTKNTFVCASNDLLSIR